MLMNKSREKLKNNLDEEKLKNNLDACVLYKISKCARDLSINLARKMRAKLMWDRKSRAQKLNAREIDVGHNISRAKIKCARD